MSTLRPECKDSDKPVMDRGMLWRRLYKSVRSRRSLAYGKLDAGDSHCAMGCFWADNSGAAVPTEILEQVAAVNDSVPPTAKPSERRKHVLRWLDWKLETLGIKP